ncbi:unnamed protein product [Mytilus edulis]|uniref:Uncharacterized protein n=1 Tax=Mytilus edulis TaxID=6550 RepID=A0A8S3QRB5_MYTED|nr:unnamed protein product [Mytilus edulis]
MKIPKDYKTDENNKMILPNKWLLAYIDPDGPFNFVSWSSDFRVLSLGLLSDGNSEPIYVKINDTAANCDVKIGGNYMITEIVKLFTDFIREKVELDRHYDYENIHLCYLTKFEWFKKSAWYEAKQMFGIPFQEFGYKCCMVREEKVCCDDKLHRIEGYRLLLYIISIFLVLFSPIALMYIADSSKEEETSKEE